MVTRDAGNTPNRALNLRGLKRRTVIQEGLNSQDTADVFQFRLDRGKNFRSSFQGQGGSGVEMVLTDRNQRIIAAAQVTNGKSVLGATLEAGVYYLTTRQVSGEVDYKLILTAKGAPPDCGCGND